MVALQEDNQPEKRGEATKVDLKREDRGSLADHGKGASPGDEIGSDDT